jgi:UDP-glucuronate 4-epimerase
MTSRVLITGGAGFIGSHLAEHLLAAGKSVVVLDNFDPYYDREFKRRNLELLSVAGGQRIELVEGDLRDPSACARAVEGASTIVHLAGLAGVRPSIAEPVRYMDVNVTGTQVLLNSIQDSRVRVVFGSSSSVYGGGKELPFHESQRVDFPVSPYAASKKAGEVLCHAWHHLHGNAVTCLRFFTVYGPRQRPEMAIHKFARMITSREAIPFFGSGASRRDYTYVDDIVSGLCAAMERAEGYSIYNLGGAATTTLSELVQQLEQALGVEAILDRQPDQPGDVPATYADVSRAERELGYCSETPLAEGIKKFCSWYVAEKAAGNVA